MRFITISCALLLVAQSIHAQLSDVRFIPIPDVPPFVEANAKHTNHSEFLKLWKFALQNDEQESDPTIRVNFEPKTIVAPEDLEMLNVIPQDLQTNPLYDPNPKFASLRKGFILDHIVLDMMPMEIKDLIPLGPMKMVTLSGKDLMMHFRPGQGFLAEQVPIRSATSLQDFTKMITLRGILYDAKNRVARALGGKTDAEIRDADTLGPPLDLIESKFSISTDESPPSPVGPTNTPSFRPSQPLPPAAPTPEELEEFLRGDSLVPSNGPPVPSVESGASPPAPPTADQILQFMMSKSTARSAKKLQDSASPGNAIGKSTSSRADMSSTGELLKQLMASASTDLTQIAAVQALEKFAREYGVHDNDEPSDNHQHLGNSNSLGKSSEGFGKSSEGSGKSSEGALGVPLPTITNDQDQNLQLMKDILKAFQIDVDEVKLETSDIGVPLPDFSLGNVGGGFLVDNDKEQPTINSIGTGVALPVNNGLLTTTNANVQQQQSSVGVPLPSFNNQRAPESSAGVPLPSFSNQRAQESSAGVPLPSFNNQRGQESSAGVPLPSFNNQRAPDSSVGVPLPSSNGLPLPTGPDSQQSSSFGVPLPTSNNFVGNSLNELFRNGPAVGVPLPALDNAIDSSSLRSVEEVLRAEGLTKTMDVLMASGLMEQLLDEDSGTFILFAPSNEAYDQLTEDEYEELKSDNIRYHVIPLGDMPAPEVTNDSTFSTLSGDSIRFNMYGDKVYINGVSLVRGDIKANRGTIQIVESVLEPPVGYARQVLEASTAPVERTVALLDMFGDEFMDDSTMTIFAPLDASITSKGFQWPNLLEDQEMASRLLNNHIVSGTWYSAGLSRQRSLMSNNGVNITFRDMQDGTITANGVPILMADLSTNNGVVHVVADLIPTTDLGTDVRQSQGPLLSFIRDDAFSPNNNFNNNPNQFLDRARNIPDIPELYQTPVQVAADISDLTTASENVGISGAPDTDFFVLTEQEKDMINENYDDILEPISDAIDDLDLTNDGIFDDNIQDISTQDTVGTNLGDIVSQDIFIPTVDDFDSSDEVIIADINLADLGTPLPQPDNRNPSIGLYSAPLLTNDQRADPVTSDASLSVPADSSRQKSVNQDFETVRESLVSRWEALGKNFDLAINGGDVTMDKIAIMDQKLKLMNQLQENDHSVSSIGSDEDSFFLIAKGNLDLNEMLSELDDEVRQDIMVFDIPTLMQSNSPSDVKLKIKLSQMLSQQLQFENEELGKSIEAAGIAQNMNNFQSLLVGRSNDILLTSKEISEAAEKTLDKVEEVTSQNPQFGVPLMTLPLTKTNSLTKSAIDVDLSTMLSNSNEAAKEMVLQLLENQKSLNEVNELNHSFMLKKMTDQLMDSKVVTNIEKELRPTTDTRGESNAFRLRNKVDPSIGLSLKEVNQRMLPEQLSNSSRGIQFFVSLASDLEKIRHKTLQLNAAVETFKSLQNDKMNTDVKTHEFDVMGNIGKPLEITSARESAAGKSTVTSPGKDNVKIVPMTRNSNRLTNTAKGVTGQDSEKRTTGRTLAELTSVTPPTPIATTIGRDFFRLRSLPDSMQTAQTPQELMVFDNIEEVSSESSHEHEMNVIEFLRSENLTAFADLIDITGLNRDLIRGGPWTIFAPSNEGIEIVAASGGLELSMKDLRHLAAYHVVPGLYDREDFVKKSRLPTLYAGYSIYMEPRNKNQWSVGGGLITDNSSTRHHGPTPWMIHVVDRVLYAPHGNLYTTMSLAPDLTTFTKYLREDEDVIQMLKGREPVTVFAPSNSAFEKLTSDVRPTTDWLMSHIADGFKYSVCFSSEEGIATLAGNVIDTFTNQTNGIVNVNNLPASYLDISAANGVLHVIDDFILPPP